MEAMDDLFDELLIGRYVGTELREMPLGDYRLWIRDLPWPTADQVRAFVDHVVAAHSWYKHLPLKPPGATFHFYIDPRAGMERAILVGGEARFFERTAGMDAIHYSTLPTHEYLERFGHLAFACASLNTMVSERIMVDGKPAILDANHRFAELWPLETQAKAPPREIFAAGSCEVTGLVHPRATGEFLVSLLQAQERPTDGGLEDIPLGFWGQVERLLCKTDDGDASALESGIHMEARTALELLVGEERRRQNQVMFDSIQRMVRVAYGVES